MKKTHIILTLILFALFSVTAYAQTGITCTTSVDGTNVIITGQISGVDKAHQVTLLVGNIADYSAVNPDDIIYINQTQSDSNGNFTFEFNMPEAAETGQEYSFAIGSDAGCPKYVGVIGNKLPTYTQEREILNADVTIDVVNYVPTISGTLQSLEGKNLTLQIQNITNSTVIANETISPYDGLRNISYTLPSLLTARDYAINIICADEESTLASISVEIDSSIVVVSIDGNIQTNDNVKIDARVQGNSTELIDKSLSVTGTKEVSATLPNVLANMSFRITASGYETVTVFPTETLQTTYSYSGTDGDKIVVPLIARNVSSFENRVFEVLYNSDELLLDSASVQEEIINNIAGKIEFVSIEDGNIKFRLNDVNVDTDSTFSGVINLMSFQFNSGFVGTTQIEFKMN
ncbi:MAG: hypothetical protein IJ366_06105 [Clostridia bacterium]|nr:hypothetical protein [Clostridia bacterium]